MISFPRLIILSLLATSLHPLSSYAFPDSANPGISSNPTEIYTATQQASAPEIKVLSRQPLVLTMKAAIEMSIRRNVELRIEAHNSKLASVEVVKSYGVYNPVLNLSGTGGITAVPGEAFFLTKNFSSSIGITQNLPTGGNISATTQTGYFRFEPATTASKEWQSTAGLAFSQPLLRSAGKETFELYIILAATSLQDSLERFRNATIDTVSNVIASYNHLYVLLKVKDTREAALLSAQTLLDGIKKKASGTAQELEIANAEFAIAQRRKDFVEATRSVTDQEANLRYLIGLESLLNIVPSDPPSKDEPAETDTQAVKAALELRSDLKQLTTSLHSAQLQERVARHQSLPELTINASGGLTGTGFNISEGYQQISSNPGTYWTAGMLFSVPLGNTTARNEYIKSKIRTEQVQDQIKALSWRIRNDVEYDMRSLISARLQMQLADKSSQFADQRFGEYRKNYLLNMASIQDVLNAENDLNVARNSQLEAVETFSNAVTKLWKDTGLLLDHYGIHIFKSQPMGTADNREQDTYNNMDLSAAAPMPGNVVKRKQAPHGTQSPVPSSREDDHSETEKLATASSVTTQATATQTSTPATKTYTLEIGEFSSKTVMADAIAKIKSIGLVPQVKQGSQKVEQVIRLFYAAFTSQLQAQKALKKVQLFMANGFIQMNEKQRHAVYAGSFIDQKSALLEQKRLAGHGIKVRPEKASASLPTFTISAGNILGREAALEYMNRLEHLGLKSVVAENP
ncbi:MAG: TolC family protein [Steroidobacteraceae bacterium]|nr:TolC family protein [Deltaproteobacteria bacterium]